jgi:hypothetical protein
MTDPTMVLGIDPGPKVSGWALLDFAVRSAPVFFDGGTASSMAALFDHLALTGVADNIGLVGVEEPRLVHNPYADASPEARYSSTLAVMHTSWAGGRALGWAEARGYGVMPVGPNEWRRALVGPSRRGDDVDTKVKATLPRVVRYWPERCSVHVRDGGGVAHFAAQRARFVPRILLGVTSHHARESRP